MNVRPLFLIGFISLLLNGSLQGGENPVVDVGAYGQILHQVNRDAADLTTVMVVPELKFHLAPDITFDLEIGLEYDRDSDSDGSEEIDVEEAAFTIAMGPNWTTRIGKMHLPVGVYNLYHEPVYFHSVFPSEVEQKIIPNEWHENGALVSYRSGEGKVSAGIYGGLSQSGMNSAEWMRGTSLEGEFSRPKSYAAVLRYDYGDIDQGTLIGGSVYRSGMTGIDSVGKSYVTLYEVHARKAFDNGMKIALMAALGRANKTAELSSALGEVIGKKSQGWYADVGYDLAKILPLRSTSLPCFVRYERFDTQADVASGLIADPANSKSVTTAGVNYYPYPNVVLKADYQFRDNDGAGERNRIEFGAGFVY